MTKKLTFVLLVIALFFFVNLAVADMYKWVDQNGVIHFSDTPPSTENQVETNVENAEFHSIVMSARLLCPKVLIDLILKGR